MQGNNDVRVNVRLFCHVVTGKGRFFNGHFGNSMTCSLIGNAEDTHVLYVGIPNTNTEIQIQIYKNRITLPQEYFGYSTTCSLIGVAEDTQRILH